MELSIIILSYNTKALTLACINSIVEEYKEELLKEQFEVIVVDNASSDGSLSALKRITRKGIEVLESGENLGFSKGCNFGAKSARGKYLLFLNSDTVIKDQGFLKMVDLLNKNENYGVLGGKLKNDDGTAQPSTGRFYNLFTLFFMLLGLERFGLLRESPKEIKEVDWVSGACLMIKKSVFEKIGGFDKDIFMYTEDMELCYKAKKQGFKTYFFPEIMLYHKSLGSSNRAFAILNIYKGIILFYKTHKSKPEYLIAKFMLKLKAVILVVFGQIVNNKYLKETYSQALKV
ncbi:MAG TPA: glycosyltransferase family 2 protein [Candidatus Sulfotelmatobacter sp.]|nr:glycosyltransferase family 2 protein [Candidatus Sulfotelmatobacter sp.]